MKNKQKIEIAKDFVHQHKHDDLYAWLGSGSTRLTADDKYLTVYDNLSQGVFGEIRRVEGANEIEIGSGETKTGVPIIFEWEN